MLQKLFIVALAAAYLVGCQSAPSPTEEPKGWETAEDRWWQAEVDTAQAFRALETFQAMGIPFEEVTFASNEPLSQQPIRMKRRLINEVKKELLPLYRHRPDVVDSLFQSHVEPLIRNGQAPTQFTLKEQVKTKKDDAYRRLRRHFTEPRARLKLGEDVPVVYPDSLRRQGVSGTVRMQVYLNKKGEPLAIKMLEPVHPVLDRIARRAATQMRWHPAYLNEEPVRSWVRYAIRFAP